MKLTQILTFVGACVLATSCATKAKLNDSSAILSDKYLHADSVYIQITYTLVPSCLEQYKSELIILFSKEGSKAYHMPHKGASEKIEAISEDIMDDVRTFEVQGKSVTTCGGYEGGNGILVKMVINQDSTQFAYCQDTWDGISELLANLKKKN